MKKSIISNKSYLPSYSVAIRTLGKSGEMFEKELQSIITQTILPEKIIIYIAEGFNRPDFSLGIEKYVEVKKGMVSQRALDYTEIDSDFILLLDDDVQLAPDSAEKLLKAATNNLADCVSADTFHNQNMSFKAKLYNILVNMTFPFHSNKWAMKIGADGAMSYNSAPENRFYETQAGEGPAILVRKSVWLKCDMKSELWMDSLGFAYADDFLEVYKLHLNGFKCGTLYDSGIVHLNGATSSRNYKMDANRYRYRSRSIFINWHRMKLSDPSMNMWTKFICIISFIIRCTILQFAYLSAAIVQRNPKIMVSHCRGLWEGFCFTRLEPYRNLPSFVLDK